MPPSRSGIADYSEALVADLRKLVDVEVFDSAEKPFEPAQFDVAVYHLGNNPYHESVYTTALLHPGIVVMHEANLHHLIAHVTIRRDDWDAYVAEAELNGGAPAKARAELARALTEGPDYEGCTMTRRILDSAKGVIVHSEFMVKAMHEQGFTGPVVKIPHGAWVPEVDGSSFRKRLGLHPDTPLIGAFGHLKPYKRIAESLRAFRRVVKEDSRAKMILVGEPHPGLPLDSLISSLRLESHVRVIGFAEIEDFVGYLAACDIVLNLRFPTVGESSGSLLRALGLGKAVLVSDIGSFQEFPDDICLKVPVDRSEENLIFEYLRLLVQRPDLAAAMGAKAKEYVARECNWNAVALQYETFIRGFIPLPPPPPPPVSAEYILSWAKNEESRKYIETHQTRLVKTLSITPKGASYKSVLEMGAYMQITPALAKKLDYGYVRGCYFGPAGEIEQRGATSPEYGRFDCEVDLFDAEHDPFPYTDASFDTVICGELIEHLFQDPMYMMSEINRILKPGGHLVLTTPNVASIRAVHAILLHYHPSFFASYIKPSEDGTVDARHNREYTPGEIYNLFTAAGFEVEVFETGPFGEDPHPEYDWVRDLLQQHDLPAGVRGDGTYCVGRKTGPVSDRWPNWLYA